MSRHLRREWMCGIDDPLDAFCPQVSAKSINATETADARRYWLRLRFARPPGEREHWVQIWQLRNKRGERAGFARAAEDQNAHAEIAA
jgi:hypothetical protein